MRLLRPLTIVEEHKRLVEQRAAQAESRRAPLAEPMFFAEVIVGGRGGKVPYLRFEEGSRAPKGRYACFRIGPLPADWERPVQIPLALAQTLFHHAAAAVFDGTIPAESVLVLDAAIKKATYVQPR